ncbi:MULTISPECIES: DNA polymerase III subunit delta [Cyanophyceae]|uniref:DNA polymerase III subunit delta n=1 Tax=Leptolyngbya subtilissima DQ-A4 TaxID=2933933 RepID=A0ABV0JYG6_9CYAN|nr:DNA polymerase III subunit delta [Nodosilinea sp. FACHB-141]MBD2112204.1 DNA polymerase III subunit delta [Nodosilinea sp. FACHB-141]
MPAYYFWGDDDFALQKAVQTLRQRTLNEAWASFNYDVVPAEAANGPSQALNQAMTPPFGEGQRLVWLMNTNLGQRCPDPVLAEFERTLPQLPDTSVLLLTSTAKPDGRAKFTKFFKTWGEVREFATIPPWKTDQIHQQVAAVAKERGMNLESGTLDLLTEAVGNDTRQLHLELEKLALYWGANPQPIPPAVAAELVTVSTQTSLKLAQVLKQGDTPTALGLVNDLLDRNEPALRIVATLVSQFRLWLWLKALVGVASDAEVAAAAEIANPKRIYFLKQEVRSLSLTQLQRSLPLLLELESDLKQGRDERATLHTKVIELCRLFRPGSA